MSTSKQSADAEFDLSLSRMIADDLTNLPASALNRDDEEADEAEIRRAIRALKYPRWSRFLTRMSAFFTKAALCSECDLFFDPRDRRAFFGRGDVQCPACAMGHRGDEAWAVTNDCNGIFEVVWRRDEAKGRLSEYDGCYVIPVRVYEEPLHRRCIREFIEARDHQ